MPPFPCPACGGEIPERLYLRTIPCPYCSKTHPNPTCLRAGDEVLINCQHGLDLQRVAKCDGPDAITVDDDETARKLEDLIPVERVTTLESGTGVYRRDGLKWVFTFTSSAVHDGQVKVKNNAAGFQDTFFDQAATLDDLRLDARPPELGGNRAHRTAGGALAAQFRDAPIDMLFQYGVKIFIAVIFVVVSVFVVRAFL